MSEGENTTGTHPAKRERKPAHPAWQTAIAAVAASLLAGGGLGLVRQQDVQAIREKQAEAKQELIDQIARLQTQISRADAEGRAASAAIIELQATVRYQTEILGRLDRNVERLLDGQRDRVRTP